MLEPQNEQGTVIYFQHICKQLGYEITSIQSAFPDAIIHDCNRDTDLRVEFEFDSNNFRAHKHDPKGADLVICWKRGSWKLDIPILELSSLVFYPPNLYQHAEPERDGSTSRKYARKPRELRSKMVLHTRHMYIYARNDGNEIYTIIITNQDKGWGVGFEAFKDDISQSSALLWSAVELAEKIRDKEGGQPDNNNPEVVMIERMILEAYQMRESECQSKP